MSYYMKKGFPRGLTIEQYLAYRNPRWGIAAAAIVGDDGRIIRTTESVNVAHNWATHFCVIALRGAYVTRWVDDERRNCRTYLRQEAFQVELDTWHRCFHPQEET